MAENGAVFNLDIPGLEMGRNPGIEFPSQDLVD
jgi:hypothetical protein